jgi:hypothetical protein
MKARKFVALIYPAQSLAIALLLSSSAIFYPWSAQAADADGDGFDDVFDNCPAVSNFQQNDADADGVGDLCDNCIAAANGTLIPDAGGNSQRDTDGDGFGNLCDADFDQNMVVDPTDFSVLKSRFGQLGFPDQDLNGNGIVDPTDFSLLKSMFG